MRRSNPLALLALAALTRTARADVTVFVGPDGGAGDVLVLDEEGLESAPPGLQGIVLLPIECTGRTNLTELLPGRARLRLDVPGAARLQLPAGRGSLYRYRRDDPAGGRATFGFFVVDPDGRARQVFEQPGTGTRGSDDPLATHVAVSERGDAILLGTRPEAGGDLLEVDLVTARSVNRTADLPPRSFRKQGLVLLSRWGVGLSTAGPLRFSRLSFRDDGGRSSTASPVPAWPAWSGADLVWSADESRVAAVAGECASQAFVQVFGESGAPLRATRVPGKLSDAGYLPERTDGPALALAPDGACVAWRTEGDSRECWLREICAPECAPDVHVTSAANFEDSLNDTGVIAFLSPAEMVLMAGEDEGAGLEGADLFHVSIGPAGALAVTNLSRTGPPGDLPPFDYGRLVCADGLHQLPGTPAWLAFDRGLERGGGAWLRLDASGRAPVELLAAAEPPRLLEVTANELYANLEKGAFGARPLLIRTAFDGQLTSWALPGDEAVERAAVDVTTDEFAAVVAATGAEVLVLLAAGGDPAILARSRAFVFGPTIGFAGGIVHVTAGGQGAWVVLALSRSSTRVLLADLPQGFVLPGS